MPTQLTAILNNGEESIFKKYVYQGKTNPGIIVAKKFYKRLKQHESGELIDTLIDEARPNESEEEKKYRKSIMTGITAGVFSKVWTCIGKIRKSRDFVIRYETENMPAGLTEEEFPKIYFDAQYPGEESYENFIFNNLMRQMILDTGAVAVVMPTPLKVEDAGRFPTPVVHIFNSDKVIQYVENDYCIIKSDEQSEYITETGVNYEGAVYYVVTTTHIIRLEQTDDTGSTTITDEYRHDRGEMPARKMPGISEKRYGTYNLTKSRMHVMADILDDLYREWSDFQISKVINAHPETIEYRSVECTGCNGSGKVINPRFTPDLIDSTETPDIICTTCKGTRYTTVGPFKKHIVTPNKLTEHPAPWPPKTFVQRDVETLRFQDEQIDKGVLRALSVVNMEHMANRPTGPAESGIKKAQDVDELLVLVYNIACDLMSMANWGARWICDFRYEFRVGDRKARIAMAPVIPVPERLDLLNMETYIERMKMMKDSGANPYLISEMHKEVAAKQFSNDPDKYELMVMIAELDPLVGYSHEDKALMKTNQAISRKDIVISAHIYPWVSQILKSEAFNTVSQKEKRERYKQELEKMADDFIKSQDDEAAKRIQMIPPGPQKLPQ